MNKLYTLILQSIEGEKRWLECAYKFIYEMPDIKQIYEEYANHLRTTSNRLTDGEKSIALLDTILKVHPHD